MQGEWGSCLFSCNSRHPFGAHFPFPALPLRSCRQQKQGDEFIVSHLLLVPSRVIRHWTIVYMHVLWLWLTHSNCGRKILLFSKNILGPLILISGHFPVVFCPISHSLFWNFLKKSVIQELRTRKNGLIKRFSRVGPIITHSRESSNSQRDPQDHAHSWRRSVGDFRQQRGGGHF